MKFRWAALAAMLILAAGCHKANWQAFSPAGGNFSVLMPGEPADKSRTQDSPSGQATTHLYIYSTNDAAYAVSYTDRPASTAGDDPQQFLNRLRDAQAAKSGGKLLAESPIRLANAWPGLELRASVSQGDGKHAMRTRMYLVNKRLYQVLVILPQDQLSSPDVEKFLDSFKLQ